MSTTTTATHARKKTPGVGRTRRAVRTRAAATRQNRRATRRSRDTPRPGIPTRAAIQSRAGIPTRAAIPSSAAATPTRRLTPTRAATKNSAATKSRPVIRTQQAGYQDAGGYPPPSYEQRPPAPAGYGDQAYRPGGGYAPPGPPAGGQQGGGGQPGYGGYGDYAQGARGPARPEEGGYGQPEQRPGYPDGGGYDPGYQQGGQGYGRPEYPQADYTQYAESPQGGYAPPSAGYPETVNREYDYGQPPAAEYGQPAGGYGGYGQVGYGAAGTSVTLQLDDGSGRTYQLREGSNIVGRGQDAQFRLPDTGVSRRHLEIRWDGQVALLADLNSTNGTTVNNAPVQEWQLADGDVVRLGHSEIIVRIH